MMGISMKTHNIVPLSVLMVLQLTVVSVVNQSAFDISLLDILKDTGGVMLAIGAVSGWLSHLIPAELKSVLVFWRWRNVLPGHRFIQLSERDTRIDIDQLKLRVVDYESLKSNQNAQNSYWYREFYRPVTNHAEIVSTHRSYLLYRDAAAISFVSMFALLVAKQVFSEQLLGVSYQALWVFVVAIAGFSIAARNAGQRLVTTAIAVRLAMQ
ncbi:TPA: hypothetical protein KD884_000207 [Vibrio parahaemolyticus]|uniref:hypothetical protein n=2 Tax=Vibrio parahaemolyticus TaxID=670 RepID=UPI0006A5769D|nr:hypothetical protein [Vibrio parahaemolyticus]KOC99122.1 hypothetical protein ACS82_11240 [Vibrio parahaemolyticus]TOF28279.1 hypothetical protein CGJ27_00830 [Vibrio parahaemolyticus]HBC3955984.1 hypothetical protein [Vibrio parahaemolyticus]HCD5147575.1 hypothetical protein [Vibrio parahaemolyticus]HCD5184691.1 hypothetical protein [Vibrio parahaemolyticus]